MSLGVDVREVSACLITKDPTYPIEILAHLSRFSFGEILVLTHSDSPFRKHELFAKAKYDTLYYQDDDCIAPVAELIELSEPHIINVAMKEGHYAQYAHSRATMGIGWGSIFPKSLLSSLKKYTDVYGEDDLFKRETERVFTYLNYPQNRLILPIIDLPSAFAADRLWRQPQHYSNIPIIEERCQRLIV